MVVFTHLTRKFHGRSIRRMLNRRWGTLALSTRLAAMLVTAFAGDALAADPAAPIQMQNVAAGSATIAQNGNLTTITAADRTIINYAQFDVPADLGVRFVQPSATATVLNRINSIEPSRIDGSISANGIVYFVNPSGVMFGQGAVINAAGFVAAAANMADNDFLAGRDLFTGARGTVVNQGRITADRVALVGSGVSNQGTIIARNGVVTLAAGDDVYLSESNNGGVMVRVTNSGLATTGGVTNAGTISAAGGCVALSAGDLYSLAVQNSGSIDVSSADGQGGTVALTGKNVAVTGSIDASGATGGGQVNVGGSYQGQGPLDNAQTAYVGADATIKADGGNGQVVVWSDQATGVFGTISARGGQVETSGKEYLGVNGATVTADQWLLDPTSVAITNGATTDGSFAAGVFTPDATATASVNNASIVSALEAGTSVTINTASAGAGAGHITVDAPISPTLNNGDVTITFNATGNFTNAQKVQGAGANDLNIVIAAGGAVSVQNQLDTNGGDITSSGTTLNSSLLGFFITSGGNITLNHSGAVNLATPVSTSGGDFVSNGAGTFTTTNAAPFLTSGGLITVNNTGAITIGANLDTTGAAGGHVHLAGASTALNANVATTAGDVTFDSAVTLGAAVNVNTANGDVTFTGNVNGAQDLTISAGTGMVAFSNVGNAVALTNLSVLSSNGIDFNGTTYTAAQQSYSAGGGVFAMGAGAATTFTATTSLSFLTGSVTLSNGTDLSISTPTGTISLLSIDGTSSENVTINAGAGSIVLGDVGMNVADGIGAVTLTAGGGVTVSGDMSTTGAIDITGTTAITGDVETDASLLVTGNATITGDVTTGTSMDVTGNAVITGDVETGTTLDIDGNTTLNGEVSSGGIVTLDGNLTLTGDSAIATSNDALTVGGTTNGAFSLAVNTGTAATTFTGNIGGATPLTTLTIAADSIPLPAATSAGTVILTTGTVGNTLGHESAAADLNFTDAQLNTITTTTLLQLGNTSHTGNILIGGTAAADQARNIAYVTGGAGTITVDTNGLNTTAGGTATFTNAGALTIDGAISADGAVTQNGAGAVALNANITTTDDNITVGAATTLGAAITVDTGAGAGNISFAAIDGAQTLDLIAGTGNVTTGAVGGTTPLTSFTVTSATTANLGAVATSGAIDVSGTTINLNGATYASSAATVDFTGAVVLGTNVAVTGGAGAGDNIGFTGTINGGQTLNVNAGALGNVAVTGAIGNSTALTTLTIAGNDISLANIGGAAAGVTGATSVTAGNQLALTGTAYNANQQTYTAAAGANLLINGASVVFTSTNDAIAFSTADVTMGDIGTMTVNSGGGAVSMLAVDGTSDEDLTINAGAGNVAVGAIGAGGQINTVAITGGTITLNGDITTSNAAGNNVTLTGSVSLPASRTIDTNTAGADGNITINGGGTVSGTGAWTQGITLDAGTGVVNIGSTSLNQLDFLSLTAGSATLGALTLGDGGNNGGDALVVATTGTLTLNGNIRTDGDTSTNAGNIDFSGVVGNIVLSTNVELDTDAAGTDANITLAGAWEGTAAGAQALTLTAGGGDVTVGATLGAVTQLGAVTITADEIALNENVESTGLTATGATSVTLGDGANTFDVNGGNIVLTSDDINMNAAAVLTSTGGGSHVELLGGANTSSIGLSGAAADLQLTQAELDTIANTFGEIRIGRDGTQTGAITVDATTLINTGLRLRSEGVGGSIAINGALALTGAGEALTIEGSGATTTLAADITTNGGAVTINDSVLVDGARTIATDNGTGLVAAAAIHITGDITGNAGVDTLSLDASGSLDATVDLDGNITSGAQSLEGLTVEGSTVTVHNIAVSGAVALTGSTVTNLNGTTITLTDNGGDEDFTVTGNVTLGAAVTITGTGSAGEDVSITGTVNGNQSLTIASGAGATTIGGAIGGSTALSALTINSAGAGAITLTGIGTGAAEGVTGATAVGNAATASVTFNGTNYRTGGAQTYTAVNGQNFVINGASAAFVTTTNAAGITFATGDILTGDIGSLTIQTNNGAISVDAIDGNSDEDLTINAGTALISRLGVVGAGGEIDAITITSASTNTYGDITGSSDAGNIVVNGPIWLNADLTITASAGGGAGNITITGGIADDAASNRDVTILNSNNAGTIALNGIGTNAGQDDINDLSITSTNGVITLNGSLFTGNNAGDVTIDAGTANIVLGADITIDSNGTADGNVTLSSDVDGAHTLTIDAGTGTVALQAVGATTPVSALTATGSTITLNDNITTGDVAGNNVTLTGAVALGGNVTIDTNTAGNDGNISFTSTVDGGTNDLALDAGGGDVTVGGDLTNTGTLTLTSADDSTFSGVVTVATAAVLGAGNTGAVTVQGALTAPTLTVNAGAYEVILNGGATITNATTFNNTEGVTLGNNPADVLLFNGGVTSTASTTTTNALIRTSGDALTLGTTTLAGNTTLDTTNNGADVGGGDITTGAVTGATFNLTLNAGNGAGSDITVASASGVGTLTVTNSDNATFSGAVAATTIVLTDSQTGISFNGAVTATTLTTTANGYDLALNGGGTITADTNFLNTGTLTLGNDAGDVLTFVGGLDTTGGPSTVNLAGTIRTTDTQMDLGAVTLTAATTLDSDDTNAAASIINLGAVTSGGNSLTLNSGSNAAADITVASFADGGNITLTHSGGTTFTGTVAAGTITLSNTTGTIAFQDNLTATTLITAAQGYAVSITGGSNAITNTVTFSNTGGVTLGNADADVILFDGGVNSTASTTTTNALIRTSGDALTFGATTLAGNTTLDTTNNGADAGGSDIATGAITGGGFNLILNAGNGVGSDITVASAANLGTLTVTQSDNATFSGAVTATTVTLTDTNNAITFGGALTTTTLNTAGQPYSVVLNGGGTITDAVTFANTGGVTIGNEAGDTTVFNGGVDTTAGATNIAGTVQTTNDNVTFAATTVTANAVINTGTGNIQTAAITLQNGVLLTMQNVAPGTVTTGSITGTAGGAASSVTISSGGAVSVTGAVGTDIGTVTLTNAAGATFASSLAADTLSIANTVTGTVQVDGNLTLSTLTANNGAYAVVLHGAGNSVTNAVTFANTGGVTLGNGGDSFTFDGGVTSTASTTTLNAFVNTTGDNITLGVTQVAGDSTLSSGSGNIVIGAATIADGFTLGFQTTTGTVTASSIAGTAGGAASLITFNTGGAVTVSGAIGTDISELILTNTGGATFNSTVDAGIVTLMDTDGAITFNGALTATTLNTTAQDYSVALNGGATITNAVTFSNNGGVTLGNEAGDTTTFTNGVTSIESENNIAGTIQTTDSNVTLAEVEVTANATITTGTGDIVTGDLTLADGVTLQLVTTTGDVTTDAITGTVDGAASNVTFNAGGDVLVNEAIGTDIGTVTVTNSNSTTFSGAVTAATITLTNTTGLINFDGLVTATDLSAAANGFGIEFNGNAVITNAVTLANTGGVALGDADADVLLFNGGLTSTASTTSTHGFVRTSGDVLTLGTVTLDGDTTLDTTNNGGTPAGNDITTGDIDGAFDLTLIAGLGDIDLGVVGGVTPPTSLTVNSGGSFTSDAMTIDGNLTLIVDEVDFNGTISADSLTIRPSTGAVTLILLGNDGADPGASTLDLNDTDLANISGAVDSLTVGQVAGTVPIEVHSSNATVGVDLTLNSDGTGGSFLATGALSTAGNNDARTLDINAPITLSNNLVTEGGIITLTGDLTLGAAGTWAIDATNSGAAATGANVIVDGNINDNTAGTTGLAINAGTAGAVTVDNVGNTTRVASFSATGTAILLNGTQFLSTGNQSYTGAVTLNGGGATTFDANGVGSTIGFSDALIAGARALTLVADEINFGGNVSGSSTLTLYPATAAESIGLGGAAGTLALDDAELAFIQEGFSSIIIGRTNQTNTVNTDSALFKDQIQIYGTAVNIADTGAVGYGLATTGSTANNSAATITINSDDSTTTLSGDVETIGAAIVIYDAVVLAGNSNFITTAGGATAGANITLNQTGTVTGAGFSLGFDAGTGGNVLVTGAVSGVNALTVTNALDVTFSSSVSATTVDVTAQDEVLFSGAVTATTLNLNDANDATFASTVNATTLAINAAVTGDVQVTGNLTAGTLTAGAGTYVLILPGSTNVVTNAATLANTGGVFLGDASTDSNTFTGGLTSTASVTHVAGTLATTNTAMVLGTVVLEDTVILTSGSGAITINGEVNSDDNASYRSLTINSTGVTTLNGDVGGNVPLASFTTNAGGTTVINSGVNAIRTINTNAPATTGAITLNDTVMLGANTSIVTTHGGTDTVGGTITISGNISGVGAGNADGWDLTITGDGAPVTLTGAVNLSGGTAGAAHAGLNSGDLTITGSTIAVDDITLSGTAAAGAGDFNGGNAGLLTLTPTGANVITLNGNITANAGAGTGAGLQGLGQSLVFAHPVLVGDDITLTTSGWGGHVRFLSTINGIANSTSNVTGQGLTIQTDASLDATGATATSLNNILAGKLPVVFIGGNIGLGADGLIGTLAVPGDDRALKWLRINTGTQRAVANVPIVATVASAGLTGALDINTAAAANRTIKANAIQLGRNEKFTVLGDLTLDGSSLTTGIFTLGSDLNVIGNLRVQNAATLRFLRRRAGQVLPPTGVAANELQVGTAGEMVVTGTADFGGAATSSVLADAGDTGTIATTLITATGYLTNGGGVSLGTFNALQYLTNPPAGLVTLTRAMAPVPTDPAHPINLVLDYDGIGAAPITDIATALPSPLPDFAAAMGKDIVGETGGLTDPAAIALLQAMNIPIVPPTTAQLVNRGLSNGQLLDDMGGGVNSLRLDGVTADEIMDLLQVLGIGGKGKAMNEEGQSVDAALDLAAQIKAQLFQAVEKYKATDPAAGELDLLALANSFSYQPGEAGDQLNLMRKLLRKARQLGLSAFELQGVEAYLIKTFGPANLTAQQFRSLLAAPEMAPGSDKVVNLDTQTKPGV